MVLGIDHFNTGLRASDSHPFCWAKPQKQRLGRFGVSQVQRGAIAWHELLCHVRDGPAPRLAARADLGRFCSGALETWMLGGQNMV